MSELLYIIVCGVGILAVVQLIRFTRRLFHRIAATMNTCLETGLISSGFVANTAYLVLFALILRICLV